MHQWMYPVLNLHLITRPPSQVVVQQAFESVSLALHVGIFKASRGIYGVPQEAGGCGMYSPVMYIAFNRTIAARTMNVNPVVLGASVDATFKMWKARVAWVEVHPVNLQLAPQCMILSYSVLDTFCMLSMLS